VASLLPRSEGALRRREVDRLREVGGVAGEDVGGSAWVLACMARSLARQSVTDDHWRRPPLAYAETMSTEYWFNVRTKQIEEGAQSSWSHLLGPYATRAEAAEALKRVEENNETWDEETPED